MSARIPAQQRATDLDALLTQVRACAHCADHLPLGPRPVLRASASARVLIVGQAPGTKVHATGIPWNDPSGDRLRDWLALDRDAFYDVRRIAIVPMGFCYPGRGKSGDLPPRPECAELWHEPLLAAMPRLQLILLVGQYAQRHYLPRLTGQPPRKTLTETVRAWREYQPADGPRVLPLVHPSPRNRLWLKRNPWFEGEVVPQMRREVAELINTPSPD